MTDCNVKYALLSIGLLSMCTLKSSAQLTPPGLDGAKTVGWVAVGFTQTVSPRWSTSTYIGTSTQSSLANSVFWKKRAISVIDHEWAYKVSSHWQTALAISLRSQNKYADTPPYSPDDPAVRTELRTYARIVYRHERQGSGLKWSHTFRPEFRQFFTPDWHQWLSPLQIRLRGGSKLNYALNATNTTQLIVANDLLFTLNRVQGGTTGSLTWSPFKLSEDRLSMFVRRVLKKPAVNVDVGLMHQFWWDDKAQKIRYTTYFALDFQFRDPLKKRGHSPS